MILDFRAFVEFMKAAFIGISLMLATCAWSQDFDPNSGHTSLTNVLSLGPTKDADVSSFIHTVGRAWQTSRHTVNAHRNGLLPTLLLAGLSTPVFPYFAHPFAVDQDKTVFFHFGPAGFLVGKTTDPVAATRQHSLRWLSVRSKGQLPILPQFRVDTPHNFSDLGLVNEAIDVVLGPRITPSTDQCIPKGELPARGIGTGQVSPHIMCIHSRLPLDERRTHIDADRETTLICINKATNSFVDTRLRETTLLLPENLGNHTVLLALEDRYTPAHITRINPETLEITPLTKSVGGALANFSSGDPHVRLPPDINLGIYHCPGGRSWVVLDGAIFKGRRSLSVDTDWAYFILHDAIAGLVIKRLSWDQLRDVTPDLDTFPSIWCATQPSIDVRCGIQILNRAGWLAAFTLTRPQPPQGRLARDVYGLTYFLLHRLINELPDWVLQKETMRLATLFYNEMVRNENNLEVEPLKNPGFMPFIIPDSTIEESRAKSYSNLRAFLTFPGHETILESNSEGSVHK